MKGNRIMKFEKISVHDINITHSANGGCIVTVGCGRFAFSTPNEMLEALKEFYNDPQKMEKEYFRVTTDCTDAPQPHPDPSDHMGDMEDRPHTAQRLGRTVGPPSVGPPRVLANRDVSFDESDTTF